MTARSSAKEWIPKKIGTVLACLLNATAVVHGQTDVPLHVRDGTSPNGKYIVEVVAATGRIEVKTLPDRKVAGKTPESDYEAKEVDGMDAVWNTDSTAFALNVSEGRNFTSCRVFVKIGGAWKEAALPEKAIEGVRAKATREGRKYQDYLSVHEWTSSRKLTLHYTGNTSEVYQLNCRLTGGDKPRVAFMETIAPEAEESEEVESKGAYEDYVFTVLAGRSSGYKDGVGAAAQFKAPTGLAVDSAGNVFVADSGNHLIRKITAAGKVSTLAGSAENSGMVDGVGAAARFSSPLGLTVDAAGNVYVADSDNRSVRKVTPGGAVSTLVDSHDLAARASGPGDPPAKPRAIAVDRNGILYLVLAGDPIIRKITPDGVVTTLMGQAGTSGMNDGPEKSRGSFAPCGIAVDGKGNLFVADSTAVLKIDPTGAVTTLAGSPDGTGAAAQLGNLLGVAVDSAGNIYAADNGNRNVRKITPAGMLKTLRNVRKEPPLRSPMAIAVDDKGWIYVSNLDGSTIVVCKPAK